MPDILSIYDSHDDIPADVNFADLFSERNGKLELTGIAGVKTQADVDRLKRALDAEKAQHKTARESASVWGDLNHDEVMSKLDRMTELEIAAADKLDEAGIDALVQGRLATKTAPLERKLTTFERELAARDEELMKLRSNEMRRQREDTLRPLMTEMKILPEHHEDVLLYAEHHLGVADDGTGFFAKEGIQGVTPGSAPKDWLTELVERRPGWLPPSVGGGGKTLRGGGIGGPNPFTHESWDMTAQGKVYREKGAEVADRLAKAAGTTVGGARPMPLTKR